MVLEELKETHITKKDTSIKSFQKSFLTHIEKNFINTHSMKIHLKDEIYQWVQGYYLVETKNKDYIKDLENYIDDQYYDFSDKFFNEQIEATFEVKNLKEFISKLKNDRDIEMAKRHINKKKEQFYSLTLNGKSYYYRCRYADEFFRMLPKRDIYKFTIKNKFLIYESDDYRTILVNILV